MARATSGSNGPTYGLMNGSIDATPITSYANKISSGSGVSTSPSRNCRVLIQRGLDGFSSRYFRRTRPCTEGNGALHCTQDARLPSDSREVSVTTILYSALQRRQVNSTGGWSLIHRNKQSSAANTSRNPARKLLNQAKRDTVEQFLSSTTIKLLYVRFWSLASCESPARCPLFFAGFILRAVSCSKAVCSVVAQLSN